MTRAELDPQRLCLEMTEMTLMDSPEVALETFTRLHEIGVQFAIDDFGTGYSSLTYLKRFPVDAVKIDRGFVADIETDVDSREIIGSIINLAKALSLEVVAEGVETPDQLELLRRLGCERAQGFLVSPALSPDDFTAFLLD
jgi:EAL domain-containing protein (putative c-di-GMP-specific phosphodiesterase class I)